jgi:hypothetical protein
MLLNLEGENLENRIIQFCYKIPVAVSCSQSGTCGEVIYAYGPHPIGLCCSNSSFYNYETQTQCNTYNIVGFDSFAGGGGNNGGGNNGGGNDIFILSSPQNFNGVGTPQNGATSLNVNVISVSENDVTNNSNHNNNTAYNSFYNGLTQEQKDWLNNHLQVKLKVGQYLQQNGLTQDNQDFLEEILNSGINNSLISAFPFFKYPVGSDFENIYPNFTSILKDDISSSYFQNDNRLKGIIQQLTNVSITQITADLTWGFGAEVNIAQLGLDEDGKEIYGLFNKYEPNKITIDIDLVNQFEIAASVNVNSPQSIALNSLITFSVVLHELVHYEDFQFDQIMQNEPELGLYFEELYNGGFYDFNLNGEVIFIHHP